MTKRSLIPLLLSILIVSACSLFDDPSSGGPASEAFSPSASTTLSAGKHHFTEFSVPDGVHVALDGDVSIRVDGEVAIEGSLSGDCATFRLEAGGNLSLTGQINNACSDEQNSSEVRLVVEGMAVIGGESPPGPVIVSGGDITIADAEGENLDLTEVVSDVEEALAPASGTSRRGSPPRQGGSGATIGAPIQPGPGGSINIPFNQQGAAVTVAVSLTAQNGAPGADLQASPDCDASGNRGQPGGSVRLAAPNGSLTVNSGVTLKAGDGGKGGDCTARGDGADQQATAGPGGRGGSVLVGGRGLTMTGVTVVRGSGGAGGNATAAAGDAEGECGRGYNATATAGEGGHRGGAGYVIIEPNDVTGTPDVTGGNGGRGGNADAAAGDGSECHTCPGGTGGSGGDATATAGDGGNGATRSLSWNITGGHRKGDGGNATARAGDGKEGATCCDPNEQAGGGGAGGAATAAAGQPGSQGKNPGIAGMSGNSPAGIGGDGGTGTPGGDGGDGGTGTGSPNVITDGDGGAPGLACADPIITLIDDREDPLVCTTLLPGKQDILQPFMDITSVNIRLSQTGEYIFHTTFDRVEGELETAIVESDQDVFEVSLNFYDSSQGLVSEDPWAPNTIAQQAIYLTYNGFFDEFDTSMASVEGGGWVQTDQTVPFSLSGDTVTISVTQELVQPSSTFAAIAGSWGEISNVWICDETGFGEDGLPGAPLPTIASPSTAFPVPTPVPTSTPGIITPFPVSGGTYTTSFETRYDPEFHEIPVGLPEELPVGVVVTDTLISFIGPVPFVNTTGTLEEDGRFNTQGTGTVAGFQDIQVLFTGKFSADSLTYTGVYSMGVAGGLPGEDLIGYAANGTKSPDTVASGDGNQWIDDFEGLFNEAFENQDADTLFNYLNPAVINLYGQAACQDYLSSIVTNPIAIRVKESAYVGNWTWERDGFSVNIPDAYVVQVDFTNDGETTGLEMHLTRDENGIANWFTDCGEPQ